MPSGCRFPDTCTLGRHDPELKGKGTAAPTGKAQGKGKGDKGGKGKGKKDKGGKGDKTPSVPKPPKLADDARVDSKGRQPCHRFMKDPTLCTLGDNCKFFHGPFSKAMLADKKKREEVAAANHEKQKAAAANKRAEKEAAVAGDNAAKPKVKA